MCNTVLALLSSVEHTSLKVYIHFVMEFAQEDVMCYSGENACILKQKLQQMDGKFHIPCSSPVKSHCRAKSVYTDSDSDTDSEFKEGSHSAMHFTDMSTIV